MKTIILIFFLSCNSTVGRFSNLANSDLTQTPGQVTISPVDSFTNEAPTRHYTDTLPILAIDSFYSPGFNYNINDLELDGERWVSFWVNDSVHYEIPLDVPLFYKEEIIKILERE